MLEYQFVYWYCKGAVIVKVKVLFEWKKCSGNQWAVNTRENLVSCYSRECTYR